MSLLHQFDLRGVGQNNFGMALIIDEFAGHDDFLAGQIRQRRELIKIFFAQ